MENSADRPRNDEAPPVAVSSPASMDPADVTSPTLASANTGGADSSGAVELLFKVANATAASLLYEVACGNSPLAAGEKPLTSHPVDRTTQAAPQIDDKCVSTDAPSVQVAQDSSPTPHTPQKSRANPGATPPTYAGTTAERPGSTELADDDSDFEGWIGADGSYSLDADGDDDFFATTPSPGPTGRRMQDSPVAPHWGGSRGNSGQRRRGHDYDTGPRAAHRAPPRYGSAPKDMRPPAPPPSGSLKALPAEHVQKFLRHVQDGDYSEALKALRKVRRQVKGRGCSKEAFGGMRALMHHLLEGYASAGRLTEALEVLENMKNGTESRLVSAAAFNALLRGLLARSSIDEARFVVRQEMVRLGVSPNEGSLNLLMDTAARAGPQYLEEAWDVLEEMQSRNLRADKYTVSILTKGISERGDKRRAPRGVLLVEHFLKTQPEDVDEVLVNSLLDVFCRMGDMPRLEATLTKMREYNIRGSAVTYGTIVKAYGKAGNIDKVAQAWTEMQRLGLEANAVTYGCMLDACVKCGHLDRALQVFNQMKDNGLHRNTILYATLIKGFAKSKDPLAARNLYREMVMEGVSCNVVVYNSLIDACVRANDLHSAAEVLQQMTSANVKPDLITFSTLIKGYCSSGELGKAMRLAEELRARNLIADEIVYNSLLEGCVKAGDLQLGMRLFTEMQHYRVRPSSVTFSILVKLLSRSGRLDLAVELVVREMRDLHGVPPTRMVWSCLVTCCVKARDVARAVMVLDLLDREGGATGSARTSMYATVIEGSLAQGEVSIAVGLCERAYVRVPPEEGMRGILSADLLRRVFEAVGVKGPEADARNLLDTIGSRLNDQVRSSLEESLNRGGRKRGTQAANGRDNRGTSGRSGFGEASSLAGMGADSLLNSSSAFGWSGGVVAAANQWPPYSPGALSPEAQLGGGMQPWDTGIPGSQWAWPGLSGLAGVDGYGGYGVGFDQYGNAAWQWPQGWDDGASWTAAALSSASSLTSPSASTDWPAVSTASTASPTAADLGLGIAADTSHTQDNSKLEARVADTPKPESRANKCVETPSTASGGGSTTERTPATTAGRTSNLQSPTEEEDDVDEQESPVNMRLFAPGSVSDTGAPCTGKSTPMRVEVPLSALLDGPPGLN